MALDPEPTHHEARPWVQATAAVESLQRHTVLGGAVGMWRGRDGERKREGRSTGSRSEQAQKPTWTCTCMAEQYHMETASSHAAKPPRAPQFHDSATLHDFLPMTFHSHPISLVHLHQLKWQSRPDHDLQTISLGGKYHFNRSTAISFPSHLTCTAAPTPVLPPAWAARCRSPSGTHPSAAATRAPSPATAGRRTGD